MCMVNRKNFICNDFTCITSNGGSVVDYCFTAHEDLSLFSDFNVHKVADIINEVGHGSILFSSSFPDHSILTWKIDFGYMASFSNLSESHKTQPNESFIKFDTRNIPDGFLADVCIIRQLHETVIRLRESSMNS